MNLGRLLATLTVGALAGAAAYVGLGSAGTDLGLRTVSEYTSPGARATFPLAPSNDELRRCMPDAKVAVEVALRTEETGRDVFSIELSGAPAQTSFTIFLLEVPGVPFGAAEYFGDVTTDRHGRARGEFELIVEEAFASTLVGQKRVRVDLGHVGLWFADPAADDFCFGPGKGPVTPFDGDDEAGIQAFNSAPSLPGAPLP